MPVVGCGGGGGVWGGSGGRGADEQNALGGDYGDFLKWRDF